MMIRSGFALVHFFFLFFSLSSTSICALPLENHISPSIAFLLDLVIVLLIVIFYLKNLFQIENYF
jgi:hypothetical protein